MPRKRSSTAPPYERAKIDTPAEINHELKKAYRAYRNKKITSADLKTQRDTLVALRAGLPNQVEVPKPAVSALCITTVDDGCQFAPGGVLMPYEMAHEAKAAHNAGAESWKVYLAGIEPQLTKAAFEAMSRVEAPDRTAPPEAPSLRLVPAEPVAQIEAHEIDQLSPKEAQLLAELTNLTREALLRAGIIDDA
jgi:hypothetical protein